MGLEEGVLRYFSPGGDKLPTPEEAAVQERQKKEIAQRCAERLAEQLRLLGIDPAGD